VVFNNILRRQLHIGKKTTYQFADDGLKKYYEHVFAFDFPPFVGAQIRECTALGKVTQKYKENK
jgi:hypothetical protein